MLKHQFQKRLDIDHQTGSGNSIGLKNTIDWKYANNVIYLRNILCQSMLYKLITIQWRRTGIIYLLVCVCYNDSRISYLSENKKCKRMTFVDFYICHRMASAKIVLRDLGLHFESRPPHTGDRPYRCDECENCCTNFHSGERPYKCDEYCYTQSSSLARHKFILSSKRPLKCDH